MTQKRTTLKRLLFEQHLLTLLLFTFCVIIVWVLAAIYFTFSKSTLTTEEQLYIEPLNPTLNMKSIDALNRRKWWTKEELANFELSREVVGTIEPIEESEVVVEEASASEEAEPTPTATDSSQRIN